MRTKMLLSTGAFVAVLFGCMSHQQTDTRIVKSQDGSFDGEIIGTPAPNSKFAKVEIGMGKRQVEDLIGLPDDFEFHSTGKEFIPYFGGNSYRWETWETYYKNEGRLTYSEAHFGTNAQVLIRIEVHANATGYRVPGATWMSWPELSGNPARLLRRPEEIKQARRTFDIALFAPRRHASGSHLLAYTRLVGAPLLPLPIGEG